MGKVKIAAIAAMDLGRVIGRDNAIPWRFSQDMQHFAKLTTGHTVLMGRKTYESLPPKFRPLPNRLNIVAGRSCSRDDYPESVRLCSDLDSFISQVKHDDVALSGDYLWIIGGSQIYHKTIQYWDEAYITLIPQNNEGDAHFPAFEENFEKVEEFVDSENLKFIKYCRK